MIDLCMGITLTYRSFAGPSYRAVITTVRDPMHRPPLVDIDVETGSKDPLHLTRVRVVEASAVKPGECHP